jgi:aminoglycoside phosphotransferase (APT) family kinase protein
MPPGKMHADEVETSIPMLRSLLGKQFPHWADLPMEAVPSAGTDNALYRLGEDLVVRMPRIHWAAGQVEKEHLWLAKLAPFLPLAIPLPLAQGSPGEGYPWNWSVCQWLEGETAAVDRLTDPGQAALRLAEFICALQRIDPTGGPPPGPDNSFRGVALAARDAQARAAIDALQGIIDTAAAAAAWEAALRVPAWAGPPVWIHGDLQPGNLLAQSGQLSAVIDFGCLGVGDPACDMIAAWNFFSAADRAVFRAALPVDNATWARGRGWALSIGLIALPYYQHTNPVLASIARRTIAEVLAEFASERGSAA